MNAREGDEFLDSIVTGDETWAFHHPPESKQAGKKFDDDDEVQEEVMTLFKMAGGRLLWLGDTEASSKL